MSEKFHMASLKTTNANDILFAGYLLTTSNYLIFPNLKFSKQGNYTNLVHIIESIMC